MPPHARPRPPRSPSSQWAPRRGWSLAPGRPHPGACFRTAPPRTRQRPPPQQLRRPGAALGAAGQALPLGAPGQLGAGASASAGKPGLPRPGGPLGGVISVEGRMQKLPAEVTASTRVPTTVRLVSAGTARNLQLEWGVNGHAARGTGHPGKQGNGATSVVRGPLAPWEHGLAARGTRRHRRRLTLDSGPRGRPSSGSGLTQAGQRLPRAGDRRRGAREAPGTGLSRPRCSHRLLAWETMDPVGGQRQDTVTRQAGRGGGAVLKRH